jgi:hypothetical protein
LVTTFLAGINMSEEKKEPIDVLNEATHEGTEGFLKVFELALEHGGRGAGAESIKGLSNVLSVAEAGLAVKEAGVAAHGGDAREVGGQMAELASIGPNMWSMGALGAAEAVWDATAAVHLARATGEDFSIGTLQRDAIDRLTTFVADQYFDVFHDGDAANVRINPNGPEEALGFTSDFHLKQPMEFEPEIVTGGSAHHGHAGGHHAHHQSSADATMVFEPQIVTAPINENTVFEPEVVTLDQNSAVDHMVITIADEMAAGPHFHEQLLSDAPDFDTGGLHFGHDLGTIPDGVSGSPDFGALAGGEGHLGPGGHDSAPPAGDSGGGDHGGGGDFWCGGGAGPF